MDLSDFFITSAQATDFATKLTAVIDSMYTTNFSLEQALAGQFGIQKKDAFLKLFRDNNINSSNTVQVQEFLKKTQQLITNIPLVQLIVAFEPTEEILKAITRWFLVNLSKQVLLEITVHPDLIAGAVITTNGKFKDYSLTKQFNTIITNALTPPVIIPTSHQSTRSMEMGH